MTQSGPESWEWWVRRWRSLITCGECSGLMYTNAPCPVCGRDYRNLPNQRIELEGQIVEVQPAFAGAINWSDYILLRLMHQEWQRMPAVGEVFTGIPEERRPSPRLLIVILFWSLFENLMQRFFEAGMRSLPTAISRDLLNRYSSIGSRLDRLYRILFDSTLDADLRQLGYDDLRNHLAEIQRRRNAFIHGNPETIDEELVRLTIERLPVVQEAWISLYNLRCTEPPNPPRTAEP
jgi:hypothetical protein